MRQNNILNEFFHLFFPEVCVACGEELLQSEECICLRCLYKLPRTGNFNERDNAAERLMAGRIPFERIASFCYYTKGGILPSLIHQLKYYHRPEIGLLMGRLFGKDLLGSDFLKPIEFIVPVPLHRRKERSRSYNQAEMIAIGLSQVCALPLSVGNLLRAVYNPTQTKRSRTERWENVKDIFVVVDPELFSNRHILLVDDVITTGSTLEACCVALQKSKGVKVSMATLGEVL